MQEVRQAGPVGDAPSERHAYDELQCYTLARGDLAFIHQHVVDAWAAQHADERTKPIGLTFALVGLLPTPRGPRSVRWAFIPALVLLIMGGVIFAAAEQLINYLWPVALILAGLYLVWRTFRPRPAD